MMSIGIIVGVVLLGLLTVGLVFARLYKRATKETGFVRTGFGGQKVVIDGGALVFPVLHETIDVNMNTMVLEVSRQNEGAIITKDRMRVDVKVEFYLRVKPDKESISVAAQTLGRRTQNVAELKNLVEGKFVDALRAVASQMELTQLHEKRDDFVQAVQGTVSEDLTKNGLELESVSCTGLDQTSLEFFNEDNIFDAEGLTQIKEQTEEKRKRRNDIVQDTAVLIADKDLEAKKRQLQIAQDAEFATLAQIKEIQEQKANQESEIAMKQAEESRNAQQSQIDAQKEVEQSRIAATLLTEGKEIEKQRSLQEAEIVKERELQQARIEKQQVNDAAEFEKQKVVELAEQGKLIAVAEKSEEQSEAQRKANLAQAKAVEAKEQVETAKVIEIAERQKRVEIIEAEQAAEQVAVGITINAAAEKSAATDRAEAVLTEAKASSDAKILAADADERQYAVDAEGREALQQADNSISMERIEMELKLALMKVLPSIIAEAVKPMDKIDNISITQLDGARDLLSAGGSPGVSGDSGSGSGGGRSLPEQVVNSALQHQVASPLLNTLMDQVGISSDGKNIVEAVTGLVSGEMGPKAVKKD